jgi:16S rRNA (cytidine1402-2'-O)-methyltransferase
VSTPPPGTLRVVATPIGNLDDLSPRARHALSTADAIAAEDTRRAGKLLELCGIPKRPMLSYFAPREQEKARAIVRRLTAGESIALVTDGGTPGISDPGAVLVAAARAAGVRVEAIPGPSAAAAALSVSSFGGDRFLFEGFLPPKAAARRKRLAELRAEPRTLVFHEAPHRLTAFLEDAAEALGDGRRATVCRELTKLHEETREGTLRELAAHFGEGARGEIVVVVEGAAAAGEAGTGAAGADAADARAEVAVDDLLRWAMAQGLSAERAAREVAALTGGARNALTRRARELAAPAGPGGDV